MHTSIHYLDAALSLSQKELAALRQDDMEQAAELAEERANLMTLAWESRTDSIREMYKERLLALREAQKELIHFVQHAQAELKGGVSRSKQEGRRLAGYKKALQFAM